MGLEPVTVTLSSFERLEILRAELKARVADLQVAEKKLRSALRELATHQYLKGVSPWYAQRPVPPGAASVSELDQQRRALHEVIRAVSAAMAELEKATGTGQPAPKQTRRNRFE